MDRGCPFAVNGCCLFPNLILIACVVLSHETRGVHNRDIDVESTESEALDVAPSFPRLVLVACR